MNIIGICGLAGSGKDTAADFLVRDHGFVRVALADPLKRFCADTFDWSATQLWGESANRSVPDERWGGLTPRHALQQLGAEWGRACSEDVWVRYAMRVAEALLSGGYAYSPTDGLYNAPGYGTPEGVVIPDVRFSNELRAVRAARGAVWRIHRAGAGLRGTAAEHASETEQASLPVELFAQHIGNDGSLDDLRRQVHDAIFWQRREAA